MINCTLTNVGTLPFSFIDGACSATKTEIFLCFSYERVTTRRSFLTLSNNISKSCHIAVQNSGLRPYYQCHKSTNPFGLFDTIQETSFHHSWSGLAASESQCYIKPYTITLLFRAVADYRRLFCWRSSTSYADRSF